MIAVVFAGSAVSVVVMLGQVLLGPLPGAQALAEPPPRVPANDWPLDAAHFDAARIWRLSQGEGQVVAVIDSGVDARQPELRPNLLAESGSFGGGGGSGLVDASDDSHGTSVAGVIAAVPTAGGVAGLAPRAKVLSVRVAASSAGVDPIAVAEGVDFAVKHRASIINVSLATTVNNPQLAAAIREAQAADIPVVAAAGNSGATGNPVEYPAALAGVVAVGGSTRDGHPWPKSESGSYVSLAAPAEEIRSTAAGGGFVTEDGTSYSAPYVAGALALLKARFPDETLAQVLFRLTSTAHPLAERRPSDVGGFGVIDPLAALTSVAPPAIVANPISNRTVRSGSARGRANNAVAPSDESSHAMLMVAIVGGFTVVACGVAAAWVLRRRRAHRS